jgi:hypothetical protein
MPTSDEMEMVGEVLVLLADDRGTPEDLKKARDLMDEWPEALDDMAAELEEAIFLIEEDLTRGR